MHSIFLQIFTFFSITKIHLSPDMGIFFLPYEIFFVLLHLLSRAKAVSKKSIAILSFNRNFAKSSKQEDGAFTLSLVLYALYSSIQSGVREYVSLILFL